MGNSTGYGYINARIHGMKRFFLLKAAYETSLTLRSVYELIDFLRRTAYRESIDYELPYGDEVSAVDRALTRYLVMQWTKILNFTKGEPHQLFQLLYERWEIENIKLVINRIISGIQRQIDWRNNIIPVKGYTLADLDDLDSIDTLETLQNWLVTKQSPLAGVLRELRKDYPDAIPAEIVEVTYDQYYFEHSKTTLTSIGNKKAAQIFEEMLSYEIEFKNMRTALRLLEFTSKAEIPSELDISNQFISNTPSTRMNRLIRAFQTENHAAAYAILQSSRYGKILPPYFSKETLKTQLEIIDPEMELDFLRNQIRRVKTVFQGIGVGLAFYWQLIVEVRNLRILNQIIASDYPREEARRLLLIG